MTKKPTKIYNEKYVLSSDRFVFSIIKACITEIQDFYHIVPGALWRRSTRCINLTDSCTCHRLF